jgi:hypothetical protein
MGLLHPPTASSPRVLSLWASKGSLRQGRLGWPWQKIRPRGRRIRPARVSWVASPRQPVTWQDNQWPYAAAGVNVVSLLCRAPQRLIWVRTIEAGRLCVPSVVEQGSSVRLRPVHPSCRVSPMANATRTAQREVKRYNEVQVEGAAMIEEQSKTFLRAQGLEQAALPLGRPRRLCRFLHAA